MGGCSVAGGWAKGVEVGFTREPARQIEMQMGKADVTIVTTELPCVAEWWALRKLR